MFFAADSNDCVNSGSVFFLLIFSHFLVLFYWMLYTVNFTLLDDGYSYKQQPRLLFWNRGKLLGKGLILLCFKIC